MLDLAAFGTMIRDARLRIGWRPIDLALEMGWSGTAPVYRLERPGPDTPRPNPQTINQLAKVLDFDYADRMTLMGFAGHLMDTEALTPREEKHLVDLARPIMDSSTDPMVLYDYRERILAVNDAVLRPFGFEPDVVGAWRDAGLTGFDLLWCPSHGFRSRFVNINDVLLSQMLNFKLDNRLRRHEAWYRGYQDSYARFTGFTALWQETDEMLGRPATEWDLSRLVPRTTEVRGTAGPPLRFDASRRALHAGYGLVTLGVYLPKNEVTRQWLSAAGTLF